MMVAWPYEMELESSSNLEVELISFSVWMIMEEMEESRMTSGFVP